MRCKTKVSSIWADLRQCRRGATKDGFCTQHQPDNVAERARVRAEKEIEERRLFWLRAYGPDFYEILQAIANGAENPKELAQRALMEFKK